MAIGPAERLYVALAPWLLPIIESTLVIAAVALTFVSQRRVAGLPNKTNFLAYNGRFARFARRKTLAIVAVGLSTLIIRIALIPVWGIPQPAWHDEFSHLLAADTFAHGRLTNPPHPMWQHFEGFHIIQQPTYMSMYPPGEGMILAVGQWLGNPWIGQLLATAFMCSCLCWMLQGWFPPRWALLGAFLAMLRLGLLSYWMNSYFGTSLPAIGGMLALGALPRIKQQTRTRDALLLAFGVAILANTRPYEGMVVSLPIASALLIWIMRQGGISVATALRRVVLPVALVLAATAASMGYYFWRVTGNAFEMPYTVNRNTYAVAPYFVWQKPRPEPVYRHAEMRDFYINWELPSYEEGTTVTGFAHRLGRRVGMLWGFFARPVFTLPFLAFPWLFRDRKMRFSLILAGAVILGNVIETWTLVHYLAPVLGLFFLLLVQCMRRLRLCSWHQRPLGQGLARAVPLVLVAMVVLRVSSMAAGVRIEPSRQSGDQKRQTIERELRALPGKQLVIVHYNSNHVPHDDWINNRADIDGSEIVWARDMGESANRELLDYFKDRRAWWINADDLSARLEPYGAATSPK
jgi:hypothetical protein